MVQHDLWKMLLPFGPFLFKYRSHFVRLSGAAAGQTQLTLPLAFEDPLSNPYETHDSVNYFYLLKLLLARLPINERVKVTYPLLVLSVGFMHQYRLWTELSLFNSSWSWLISRFQSSDLQVQPPHIIEHPHYGPTLHEFNNEQTICLPKLSRTQSVGNCDDVSQYSRSTSQLESQTPCRPNLGVSYPIDDTQFTHGKKRSLKDIKTSIKAIQVAYRQATYATTCAPAFPAKSDFIDSSAPPPIVPTPFYLPTALAPSTFYPQSQQSNQQRYNNNKQQRNRQPRNRQPRNRQPRNRNRSVFSWNPSPNQQQQQRRQSFSNEMPSTEAPNWKLPLAIQQQRRALLPTPSSAAASTVVASGPIDWSASLSVDSAEASLAKLGSSFKIAPECTDAIYRNERSLQGTSKLNPGSRIFYPRQSASVEQIGSFSTLKEYFHESSTDLELPMSSTYNTSCADLNDLLGTDGSDTAIPIQPISTQQLLMSFDELTIA